MTAPFDIFLKLDGIQGESTVRGHEKEIVVLSYEQGIDVAVAVSGGGGGASAGKATFSGVRFRKPLDKGSIPMMIASAQGKHIATARFSFRKQGTQLDFYVVTLQDVLITHFFQRAGTGEQYPLSFDALNSGANAAGFLDDVTLRYGKIQWEYVPIAANGAPAAPVKGGWDVAANKKI